jgi:hypothetical protein
LQYNSRNNFNDGIWGYGWTDSIPYIQRINKDGTNQLFAENYFYSSLDGELASKTATTFIPKTESGSFSTYSFSNNQWLVTDKRGNTYKFGFTSAGRQDNPNDSTQIFKWMLEEIKDPNGNFITFTYFKNAGQIYPSTITYSNNGVNTGIYEVDFLRQSRGDVFASGAPGFLSTTSYLISEVDVKISGTLRQKYVLTYTTGSTGNRSLLASVTRSGIDANNATTTLPATTFSYTVPSPGFAAAVHKPTNTYITLDTRKGVLPADVNGDGYQDLVLGYQNTSQSGINQQAVYLYHSESDSFQLDSTRSLPANFYIYVDNSVTPRDGNAHIVDMNGDGLADLYRYDDGGGQAAGFINNGAGWTQNTNYTPPMSQYALTDLNGDGLPDEIKDIFNGSTYITNINWDTGTAFQTPAYQAFAGMPFKTPSNLTALCQEFFFVLLVNPFREPLVAGSCGLAITHTIDHDVALVDAAWTPP